MMSHETTPAFTPGQEGLLAEGSMMMPAALPRAGKVDDTGREEAAEAEREGGAETEGNNGGREAEMLCKEMQEEARDWRSCEVDMVNA